MHAAIRKFEGNKQARSTIRQYLSMETADHFNLVNPFSRRLFRKRLLEEVADLEGTLTGNTGVVMMATFADRTWACGDKAYDFEFDKAKQKVRNAMAGMNLIAAIEPGIYSNIVWGTDDSEGCLVSFHCHAVVWSTSESKLRRHKQEIAGRFEPVQKGWKTAFPVLNDLGTFVDVLKVFRYATKMPLNGYKYDADKGTQKDDIPLKPGHHYRLFKFLRDRSLFDAWFAGGTGSKVLRTVRRDLTDSG